MFVSQKERAIEWERLKIHKVEHSEPEGARPQKRMTIMQKVGAQTPLNKNGGKDIRGSIQLWISVEEVEQLQLSESVVGSVN